MSYKSEETQPSSGEPQSSPEDAAPKKVIYGDGRDNLPEKSVFLVPGKGQIEVALTDKTAAESRGVADKSHRIRILAAERSAEILQKRIDGWTLRQLAKEYAVAPGIIHKIITREVDRAQKRATESAETLRSLHNERLESMYLALNPNIQKGNPRSIEMGLKILERQSKLNGMDEPEKKQIDVMVTMPDMELVREAKRLNLPIPEALKHLDRDDVIDGEFVLQPAIRDQLYEQAQQTASTQSQEVAKEQPPVQDSAG